MTNVANLLHGARAILFDFDGPICSVFAGYPAPRVADDLRVHLASKGAADISSLAKMTDPLDILRWAAATYPSMAAEVDDMMRAAETKAVRSASPTPYAREAILATGLTGRAVAIVSNNSEQAIAEYVAAHNLTPYVAFIAGRAHGAPELMKPHPDSIERAVKHLEIATSVCAFVGDSVTDIEVCHHTGVRSIGYSETPTDRAVLTRAGADAVIDTMRDLVTALKASCH